VSTQIGEGTVMNDKYVDLTKRLLAAYDAFMRGGGEAGVDNPEWVELRALFHETRCKLDEDGYVIVE